MRFRQRRYVRGFSRPCLVFGLLKITTVFPASFGPFDPGAFVTAVNAAEDPTNGQTRSGKPGSEKGRCLSRQEQRASVAAHAAIPLEKAVRAVKGRGDLLRARLCERRGRLLYLLTILGSGGKVLRVAIDARTGRLVSSPQSGQLP